MNVTIDSAPSALDFIGVATLFKHDDTLASDYIIVETLLLLQSRWENLGFQLKSCSTHRSNRRTPSLPVDNTRDYRVVAGSSPSGPPHSLIVASMINNSTGLGEWADCIGFPLAI